MVRRLPIDGRLQAVDREALGIENLGPYVLAKREWLGLPKAEIIRTVLGHRLDVTPRPELFEHFVLRLGHGQISTPPLIINGLDNVDTRHAAQRLWAPTVIDMGASATTAQLIVKELADDGIRLLGALDPPADDQDLDRQVNPTGLRPGRILNAAETAITAEDVSAAPEAHRPALEQARHSGQLVCGYVSQRNLRTDARSGDFSAAVPFTTGLAGVAAAAATLRRLMEPDSEGSIHYQADLVSGRARSLRLRCQRTCECQQFRNAA